MTRTLLAIAVVLAANPAHAQEPCNVTIVRAPDDVRAEIEAWVRAEPRCATSLEVRVVPTDAGFYVFARDGHGYIRERLVPNAKTVGAIVASWVADDSIDGVWAPEPRSIDAPPPLSVDQMLSMSARPPGMQVVAAPRTPRYAIMTGGFASEGTVGARVDLDIPLTSRASQAGGWFLTGSVAVAGSRFYGSDMESFAEVTSREARVGVGVGPMWSTRSWQLRARAGLVMRAMMATSDKWSVDDLAWTSEISVEPALMVAGEASVLVSRRIGSQWWLFAGPVIAKPVGNDGLPNIDYEPELTMFGGVSFTR